MEVTRPSVLKGTYMMIISQGLRRRSFTRIGFIYTYILASKAEFGSSLRFREGTPGRVLGPEGGGGALKYERKSTTGSSLARFTPTDFRNKQN